jgi:hypothetical protein
MLRFVRTLFECLDLFWLSRDCTWPEFKRLSWYAKPIRCAACRGWFMRGAFFNPGKPHGLTCSAECCLKLNPDIDLRTGDR